MKFKVKSIIAYMIIACMLMTFMPVLAADTYESFSPVKLTIEFQGGGASSANQKIVLPKENFPFELTANDQLNGYWLTGSATHTETGVVSNFNYVKIVDSVLRDDGDYEIHFAKINDFNAGDSRSNIYDYDITLSMTSGATVTSFEPFKLPTTQAYQNSTKVCLRKAQLPNLPFELNANDQLNGYWLNGTATDASGNVIEFKYVKITDSVLRSDGDYEMHFKAVPGFTGSGTYTYDFTLSMTSGATATSFEPFKLPTTNAYQSSNKVCIRKDYLPDLPFTFENDTLNNYFLNGTATLSDGTAYEFKDVRITDSAVRTDGDYEIYFNQSAVTGWTGSGSYTYDLTLSMVGFVNLDNFETVKLPTTGAYQSSNKVCLRKTELPKLSFNLDANDLLNGFWLNGTATHTDGTVYT
ncbi:MAG: hypothetical protein IKJ06_03555, partial [Clostridia bacterium]|nr:hypothetical protein [Clostridia bacterium]